MALMEECIKTFLGQKRKPAKQKTMKNISSTLFIAFLIFSWHHSTAQKIGYVNASNLLSELAVTKQAESSLMAYQAQIQERGRQMLNTYQQVYQAYIQNKNRGELSPQQEQTEIERLQSMQEGIARLEQESQAQIEKARQDFIKPINEKLVVEIQSVAMEYGYYLIFDSNSILYADPSADISSLVKLKLEERYGSDFKAFVPNIAPEVSTPTEPVFNPTLISALLAYSKNPGIEILPNGSIKVSYEDGSYNIWIDGGMVIYIAEIGKPDTVLNSEVQRAEVPKPLQGFQNYPQQETWINGLNQWLGVMAEDALNGIAMLLADDPNGMTYYSNLEKTKCSNVYERLDFRLKFFNKLRNIKESIQK